MDRPFPDLIFTAQGVDQESERRWWNIAPKRARYTGATQVKRRSIKQAVQWPIGWEKVVSDLLTTVSVLDRSLKIPMYNSCGTSRSLNLWRIQYIVRIYVLPGANNLCTHALRRLTTPAPAKCQHGILTGTSLDTRFGPFPSVSLPHVMCESTQYVPLHRGRRDIE